MGWELRARGELALVFVAVLLGCGAPRFHHVGPSAASAVSVDEVTLRWSNVYLVRKADAVVLVDSGSPVDRDALAAALGARGIAPASVNAVVVTHGHADHAGCARWLQAQGAAVVLGAGDVPAARRGSNDRLRPTGLFAALLATVFMFPFEPFTPDVVVDHEIDLSAYGLPEARVVPVAGHTPGSIAVVLGAEAFTGDMIKGGELFTRAPTEHLYQTDRAADHRALAQLLERDLTRLYAGHGGPLDATRVRTWLVNAHDTDDNAALSIDLDARGELPRGGALGDLAGTGGLRARYAIGRATALGAGYVLGADLRAGYLDGAVYEADAHPLGLALRGRRSAQLTLTAGVGLGGVRGATASHAIGELAGEVPAGPVHVLGRAALGWRLGGAAYPDDVHGIADELVVQLGVRLGRDARWGDYVAGKGPYLAVVYRDLGGAELVGMAVGIDLFAAR